MAHDAKRYWGYPESWIQHWQADLTISADYIKQNLVYLAEDAGAIVGFYGLLLGEEKAELDHLWVMPSHLGKGIGKELFLHAMELASRHRITSVAISADPNAEGFYRKMGAYPVGEMVTEIEGQPRVLPQLEVDPNRS